MALVYTQRDELELLAKSFAQLSLATYLYFAARLGPVLVWLVQLGEPLADPVMEIHLLFYFALGRNELLLIKSECSEYNQSEIINNFCEQMSKHVYSRLK